MQVEANYVDIKNREIYPAEVVVEGKKIISVKKIAKKCTTFILPGFIDAHIHIESSMTIPTEFARIAVTHGTVATVSDPHEIANVLGVSGVEYMINNAKKTPFKFFFGASPCVPATTFETNGATLDVEAISKLLQREDIYFLSEVMNFPGVITNDADMFSKINLAKKCKKPVDGHAPGLQGNDLTTYIAAGITTDHEASTYEEGLEKLQKGMKIQIREGSAAQNFEALQPLINTYYKQMMFCSDDRHPNDLLREHINALVVRALAKGDDLYKVLQMACINPVKHYNLDVGLLREGDSADFIEVEDLTSFKNIRTFISGVEVAKQGRTQLPSLREERPNIFNTSLKSAEQFSMHFCRGKTEVIDVLEHQLFTHERLTTLHSASGYDLDHDVLKIAVINRYKEAPIAVAHVHGFGLKRGAIASSVAHDSHNIIVVGCSDEELAKAVNLIINAQGGISASKGTEEHLLSLPVAGLMSDEDGFTTAQNYETIDHYVKEVLQSSLQAPYMTLSFMALLVIPELKLSDKGLFDGRSFHFIKGCRLDDSTD